VGWLLERLDVVGNGAVVFLSFAFVGIATTIAIDAALHRWLPDEVRARAGGTAAWVLSVLATIYAVLAAFVIVDEYGQLDATQDAVSNKAAALSSISENSRVFPSEERQSIENATVAYATEVVDVGFPQLAETGQLPQSSDKALEQLFGVVQGIEPETNSEIAFYDQIAVNLDEVVRTRNTLTTASRQTVPGALVAVLLINGLTIILIASLLDTQHRRSHLFILSSLALVIALSLALVVSLDQPFDGVIKVNDQPVEDFIDYRSQR
jgi:hypothetical protein